MLLTILWNDSVGLAGISAAIGAFYLYEMKPKLS